MNDEKNAIACSLSAGELQKRRRETIARLMEAIERHEIVPEGYRFYFVESRGMLAVLEEFVAFERECCSFLQFDLRVVDERRIALTMTGPDGAGAFIRETFLPSEST